jgi:hypothetical protein
VPAPDLGLRAAADHLRAVLRRRQHRAGHHA